MNNVNKTLYIPLYGKAFVSSQGMILQDKKAEEIWEKEGFPLKGKAASKWLAFSMAMRAKVFDSWTGKCLQEEPNAVVLHMGCGLDSRCRRVGERPMAWYDLDFPEVMEVRKRWFRESDGYKMLSGNVLDMGWKKAVPAGGTAVVVLEGITMYLRPEELETLLKALKDHFYRVRILMDCYSSFAAKASKYKNPIHAVGVSQVYGMDDPKGLADRTGLRYLKEHDMMPTTLIAQLNTAERMVFSNLYAGKTARKLYRMYEFEA
jgi:O-methyltransferase involved in polyketide biosynthesis